MTNGMGSALLVDILRRTVISRAYPLIFGGTALVLTVTMIAPFAPFLIFGVLLSHRRWLGIVLLSSLGSAFGGLILYLTFHYLGWVQFAESYPDLIASRDRKSTRLNSSHRCISYA